MTTTFHAQPAPAVSSDSPSRAPSTAPAAYLIAGLLLLVYLLQCAWFIQTQSFTIDEPEHIVAGLEAWRFSEFERWHDQPPLARLLFALPLLRTDWKYKLVDNEVVPVQPAPEVWLYRARAMNVLLGVALLILLWSAARSLFSPGAANFALALAVLSPDLIAHFSLATIDGVGALFIFASAVQLVRWRRRPSRAQALLLALVLALMLVAKFNSPPLFVLALLLILILKPAGPVWSPRHWNWAQAAVTVGVAFVVIWTTYMFHVSKVLFENGMVTLHFPGYFKVLTYEIPTPKHLLVYIPACEYLTGLGMVIVHNVEGHRSFFLGHVSQTGGWKAYFPVAMLLKWPLIVLALAAAGAWMALRRRLARRSDLLLMSLFPALYFAMAIYGRINIGVRHVLPVYPFLLLYAAAVWDCACHTSGAGRRLWRTSMLGILLALQAADTLLYAPDYLSYFNLPVRPARSYRLLSDSNLDWGQGLVALRNYQAAHPDQILHLAYFGSVDPNWYGIRYVPLAEGERATGTVIVSATHLSGQLLKDPASYHWLLAYPRKAILNHTLFVFEVPSNTIAHP